MSDDPNPDDSSGQRDSTLGLVILSLREHEQNLDKLIGKLTEFRQQVDQIEDFRVRFEKVEASVAGLEREINRLKSHLLISQK